MEKFTQEDLKVIPMIVLFEGHSSGGISLIMGLSHGYVKELMRKLERVGVGEYTMFDGMYNFWFKDDDMRRYTRDYCRERAE